MRVTPKWEAWLVTALCAVILPTSEAALLGQIDRPKGTLGSSLIEPFEVTNLDRMDAILTLARRYRVPLGIEFIDEAMFQRVTVRVPSGHTVKSALDSLTPSSSGFLVTKRENVFVISHQKVPAHNNVLDTIIHRVEIPGNSIEMANWALLVALDRQNRKEAGIPQSQGYGLSIAGVQSGAIAPFISTNMSVRDVLDRIVGEDGNAAWIVQVRPPALRNENVRRTDVLWIVLDYDTGPVNGISLLTQHAIGDTKGTGVQ